MFLPVRMFGRAACHCCDSIAPKRTRLRAKFDNNFKSIFLETIHFSCFFKNIIWP